jgi:hypothetical protein
MNEPTKKSLTRTQCVAAVAVALLAGLAFILFCMAATSRTCVLSQDLRAISNCRQVILSIRLYAADEGGVYPDAKLPFATDSNAVFRQLFVEGYLEDEKIFGCYGLFLPDGSIGTSPDYGEALTPDENHWAMTKGLNAQSPGSIPLVFENPAKATWPPMWNADASGQPVKGRSWSGGRIIIGTNDTSVELMKLSSKTGDSVPLAPVKPASENLFELASKLPHAPKYEVLDVAVKK